MPESCSPNEELVKSAGEEKTVVEVYDSKHGTYKTHSTVADPSTSGGPKHDPKPF
jgi:hypothetical protein